MRATLWMLLAAVTLCTLAGCQKFTRQRYETIYVGQPATDVKTMLGKPTVQFENEWTYLNNKPYYKADIFFEDGRVSKKAWFDERETTGLPVGEEPFGNLSGQAATEPAK